MGDLYITGNYGDGSVFLLMTAWVYLHLHLNSSLGKRDN